mmetsp:Transcript_41213/g.127269  ORF Transcript_41213/g.127269 Transcript_41213/m.127269 type:complete len:280 (+) Transcript_41213:3928-4767(+)
MGGEGQGPANLPVVAEVVVDEPDGVVRRFWDETGELGRAQRQGDLARCVALLERRGSSGVDRVRQRARELVHKRERVLGADVAVGVGHGFDSCVSPRAGLLDCAVGLEEVHRANRTRVHFRRDATSDERLVPTRIAGATVVLQRRGQRLRCRRVVECGERRQRCRGCNVGLRNLTREAAQLCVARLRSIDVEPVLRNAGARRMRDQAEVSALRERTCEGNLNDALNVAACAYVALRRVGSHAFEEPAIVICVHGRHRGRDSRVRRLGAAVVHEQLDYDV